VIELNDGRFVSESNAILNYLASNSTLLSSDPFLHAKVLQWQFFEQYSHEPYIAVARLINKYLGMPEDRKANFKSKQFGENKALSVMENQLGKTPYLVGHNLTIADISPYGYARVTHDGGFDLSKYSAVQAWIFRVASHLKYVGMG